jgi:hypothetical protein
MEFEQRVAESCQVQEISPSISAQVFPPKYFRPSISAQVLLHR